MKHYCLSDLIEIEALQNMADSLYQSTGMPLGIIDAVDNSILVGAGWQDICTKFHRVHPGAMLRCQESDNYIKDHLKKGEACKYKCKNGLWDIGIPIIVSGKHLATMFLGQFFYEDEIPERNYFVAQGEKFGFDIDVYLTALDQVPHFNNEKIDYILSYNKSFIGFITKLAEGALSNKIAEKKFRTLVENTVEWVWQTDVNGHYTYVSPQAENMMGYTVKEIVGRAPFDFMPSDEAERFIPLVSKMQANHERIAGLENTLIAKDGSEKNFETNGTPLFDEKGIFLGYMGTCRDITERKHSEKALHESEQRFRIMADGTPVMIWAHDAKGNIEYINTAYRRFSGVNLAQVLGQNWYPLMHEDNREKYVGAFMQALKDQKPFHAAAWVKNAKGDWRWIESYGSPRFSADGKFCGMVGSSPDITERKQAEENLRSLNKELEQKVAERTRVAKDRAKKLQKLVGELTFVEQKERQRLARILHDHLQQLLVGARMNSEILCRSVTEKHEKIAKKVLDLINQSIKTSRSLTTELYPQVLQQGLSAALKWTVRWMNENHGLTIDLQTDPHIDPKQEEVTAFLYQSTRELLLNVVKHSGVKSAHLAVIRDEEQKQLRVTVSDQGAGFDPRVALKDEGIGFGLFSIQERLQLMGGSIEIESSPGNGAALSLIVPLETKEEIKDDVIRKIRAEMKKNKTEEDKIRILVVDDHTVVRQGLFALLGLHSGIEMVGEAGDGREAVEKARELHPDVILMDINMPKMDGIQATRIISSELPGVRIVGLSMHDKQDQADQMIQAGASAYCTKDGSTDEILSAIRIPP
jgi:PAS domain S-box-containing protein